MGDIEQQITLSAVGGDSSAGEIAKTSNALGAVTQMSGNMEQAFSHRFTHIGLQLFGQDLLRTSGLGAEARQIIGTVQVAVMSASSAFGAAGGPILLVVGGLTALVGIAMKVIDAHKQEAEAIQKVIDTQNQQKKAYDDDISSLTRYAAAGGTMTTALNQILASEKALSADMKENLLVNQQKEIEALEKQRDQLGQQQTMHQVWTNAMNLAKTAIIDIAKSIGDILIPGITLFTTGVTNLVQHLQQMIGTVGQHVVLTGQFKQKYDELTASIAKMQVQHTATANGTISDLKAMADAAAKYTQQRENNELAMYKEMQSIRNADDAQQKQQMDNRLNYWIQTKQAEIDAQAKASAEEEKTVKKYTDQIAGDIGQAFAKTLVEGQNFGDAMKAMFDKIIEQIIEDLIKVIIEQQVLFYWETMTGTQGVASAGGGIFGGAFATGGSVVVDRPTMFMAGEGGPEIATFTPVGQAGGGGGGGGGGSVGSVNITMNVDHIDGNDPAGTLNMLTDQIRRETVAGRQFATTVAGVAARYPNMAY